MSIGIEIGTTGIRAAEVSSSGKKLHIKKIAEVPLSRGVIVDGEIRDTEAIVDAIKDLWKIGKFGSKTVSIGITGTSTLIRQLELPYEEADTFRESLLFRIADDLPVDPNELTLDFHPLETYMNGEVLTQKFLLVGAYNMSTELLADLVTQAGLRVARADYSPFGLIRLTHLMDGRPPIPVTDVGAQWESDVIIDVGSYSTTIAIHYHSRPLYIRTVEGGTEAITKAISEQLGISLDTAEQLKKDVYTDPDSIDIKTRKIVDYIVKALVNGLVQVVRESIDFYRGASNSLSGIRYVYVCGGGTLTPGYAEHIASELAAPVRELNPIKDFASQGLKKQYENDGRRFAGVIGLAVGVK
jgi:type IV pilus assembly protein PilM